MDGPAGQRHRPAPLWQPQRQKAAAGRPSGPDRPNGHWSRRRVPALCLHRRGRPPDAPRPGGNHPYPAAQTGRDCMSASPCTVGGGPGEGPSPRGILCGHRPLSGDGGAGDSRGHPNGVPGELFRAGQGQNLLRRSGRPGLFRRSAAHGRIAQPRATGRGPVHHGQHPGRDRGDWCHGRHLYHRP